MPVGTMFDRGIHFTIGWVNARPNIPHVLELLSDQAVNVEPIHTVAPWDSAIATIPPATPNSSSPAGKGGEQPAGS